MMIHNTVSDFLVNYEPTTGYLQQYFQKNASHFEEYFTYHCKNIEEKLKAAVPKHLEKMADLQVMADEMPGLIVETAKKYEDMYGVSFTKDVHLLVGLYGSNAYTYRQFIPEIAFCLEKLSPEEQHLRTIIAHEFGHALHNILSDQAGIDWSAVEWTDPYTWLLQEGCATYFSKQVVQTCEDVYFAFEEDAESLDFANNNRTRIIKRFIDDLHSFSTVDLFREWFSINGGTIFGHTRLAYYIGYELVAALIQVYGEHEAVTIWKRKDTKDILQERLEALLHS